MTAEMQSADSNAARELGRQRWRTPEAMAQRRASRMRKILALVARFPLTDAEAETIREFLPPVRNKAG